MADAPASAPKFNPDGIVDVPAFRLPPSDYASPEARRRLEARAERPGGAPPADVDIETVRAALDAMMAPQVARMRELYPVTVEESEIDGVPVRVITPASGDYDRERVLLNLHGGSYSMCWDSCSLLESVPIAAVGGFRIIAANYRLAPEHSHPAAIEDGAKVYARLLQDFAASRIGVFGCSAGGSLTAQLTAWLQQLGLPRPGAIGIFGAGGVHMGTGDSAYVAGYIDGSFPPPVDTGKGKRGGDITRGYFAGTNRGDPVISPALHGEVLAQFPPTLVITGTRAMDMSPAVYTSSQLIKAGVESTLIVGEAMGHCYMYDPELPESRDAFDAIVAHFRKRLGD
jgi:acetyl esterase/lipase